MKKLLALLLTGALAVGMLAGCGSSDSSTEKKDDAAAEETTEEAEDGEEASGEKAEIYVFIKNRGDLSYWDSMAEGGDRAKADMADKANIYVIETTEDLQANLTAMYEAADAGADLIITASDFKDNLVEIANEYPDLGTVIISENVIDQAENGNMYGIDFSVSEAAFLAGIAAADVASQGLDGTSAGKTVGFIGGMDETVVIQEFFLGYIQGAKYYDPETKIVYNYVGAWNDPDTARTQALTQYNDAQADAIFACAGGSGNGVHSAAAEAGKYVIGVDSDQSLMYEEDKDIQSRFITSVIKEGGNAIYATIEKYLAEGTLPYGEYEIMGVADEAAGIVENDLFNSLVSDHGKEVIAQAKSDIADGTVEIVGAIGKEQDEIKSLIDEYINQ